MKSFSKTMWGLFFLCGAAAIITYSTIGFGTISLFTVLISIFLVVLLIQSIIKLNFFGIFSSLAIALIMYSEPLGFIELSPWYVILAAVLATIGCYILFGNKVKSNLKKDAVNAFSQNSFESVNSTSDNIVNCNVSFGSEVKYIQSQSMVRSNISASFSGVKLYFDKCLLHSNGAQIYIDASFSGIELFLPKEWNVVNQIETSLGGVEIKGAFTPSGPLVMLTGKASLSGITVRAV